MDKVVRIAMFAINIIAVIAVIVLAIKIWSDVAQMKESVGGVPAKGDEKFRARRSRW